MQNQKARKRMNISKVKFHLDSLVWKLRYTDNWTYFSPSLSLSLPSSCFLHLVSLCSHFPFEEMVTLQDASNPMREMIVSRTLQQLVKLKRRKFSPDNTWQRLFRVLLLQKRNPIKEAFCIRRLPQVHNSRTLIGRHLLFWYVVGMSWETKAKILWSQSVHPFHRNSHFPTSQIAIKNTPGSISTISSFAIYFEWQKIYWIE